jgi:hypothetical protein
VSGLRIHHPTLRNCVLVVPHPGMPNPVDIHITLDNEGDAIVSETVWQHLLEARQSQLSVHEFILLDVVEHPPTQGIGWGETERKRMYKQMADVAREFAPDGVVPRITQKDN